LYLLEVLLVQGGCLHQQLVSSGLDLDLRVLVFGLEASDGLLDRVESCLEAILQKEERELLNTLVSWNCVSKSACELVEVNSSEQLALELEDEQESLSLEIVGKGSQEDVFVGLSDELVGKFSCSVEVKVLVDRLQELSKHITASRLKEVKRDWQSNALQGVSVDLVLLVLLPSSQDE
jgi:hypothetical protein